MNPIFIIALVGLIVYLAQQKKTVFSESEEIQDITLLSEMDENPVIRFKETSDEIAWERGEGPEYVRRWIVLLGNLYILDAGQYLTVTSWFRSDNPTSKHYTGEAFDARRMSSANAASRVPITEGQFLQIEKDALALGLPIKNDHTPGEENHFHIGFYRGET